MKYFAYFWWSGIGGAAFGASLFHQVHRTLTKPISRHLHQQGEPLRYSAFLVHTTKVRNYHLYRSQHLLHTAWSHQIKPEKTHSCLSSSIAMLKKIALGFPEDVSRQLFSKLGALPVPHALKYYCTLPLPEKRFATSCSYLGMFQSLLKRFFLLKLKALHLQWVW